jgi:ribonuclease BN (tRNA processing enzyme)
MSPREAGRLARLAKVETLVLCHLASPKDGDSALADAASEFGGAIHLALRDREFSW